MCINCSYSFDKKNISKDTIKIFRIMPFYCIFFLFLVIVFATYYIDKFYIL